MSKNFLEPASLIGKRVRIYRNLHKDCWSVRYRGLVVAHANTVRLANVQFVVNQGGYERFLREGRKNVHAFIVGELLELDGPKPQNTGLEVTYNPKASNMFHTVKKCFKGREYYFSPEEQLQHGWCSGRTVFVCN